MPSAYAYRIPGIHEIQFWGVPQQPQQAAGEEPGQHQHRQHQQQRAPHQPSHQLTPAEYQVYMGYNSKVYHSSQSRLTSEEPGEHQHSQHQQQRAPHQPCHQLMPADLCNSDTNSLCLGLQYYHSRRSRLLARNQDNTISNNPAVGATPTKQSAYTCRTPGIHI
jgi:hypothetical protein